MGNIFAFGVQHTLVQSTLTAKVSFSFALLAFVGPDYRFLYIEVVCQGSASDGGVFHKSRFGKYSH